ncbi:MAG: hypothetical protein AAGK14_10585 [Verrucomicrobiota bacterium]
MMPLLSPRSIKGWALVACAWLGVGGGLLQGQEYLSQWSDSHPREGIAYCGPVAAANSLIHLFKTDRRSPLATRDPREIAQHCARAMGTHPRYGTPVPFVASGLRLLLGAYGYRGVDVRVYGPGAEAPTLVHCRKGLEDNGVVLVCARLYQRSARGGWSSPMGHWFSLKSVTDRQMVLVDPTPGWELTALLHPAPEDLSRLYGRPKQLLHASAFRGLYAVVDSIVVVHPGRRTRQPVADHRLPRQSVKSTEKYTRLYVPKEPVQVTTP